MLLVGAAVAGASAPQARPMTGAQGPSAGSEFTGLIGWVVDLVATLGPVGVALLLAIDNIFPVIPSEVVLPFAGYLASRGQMSFWLTLGAATAGSVGSAYVLYGVGRRLGTDSARSALVRIPLTDGRDVDRAVDWFDRHGNIAVLTGRFVPLVRSLVSLPAGTSGMSPVRFGLLTAIGSGLWNLLWLWGGFLVGRNWREVGRYSDWINWSIAVVGAALVARYVWSRRDRVRGRGGPKRGP